MTNQIQTVNFHNQTLITLEKDGNHYVAMKPICENIGLDWASQFTRIKRDEVLNSVIVMITTTGADRKIYKMLCLPIQYLNGWLFGVDTNRVKAEIKETLITYKKECYQALFDYWHDGVAINPRRHTISVEQQAQISQAVARRCQSNRRHYQTIYSALHQKFNIPRYSELLASDFDTAMSFIRNYGFDNNGDNNGYEQLYIALTDSVTNIRAYLKLIKSLKGLPFMDENVAQKMYHDGQDAILRIAKIAQALDLQNTQGKPMFEPGRLNYYGGAALFYR